jgi:hypothetical protein
MDRVHQKGSDSSTGAMSEIRGAQQTHHWPDSLEQLEAPVVVSTLNFHKSHETVKSMNKGK